MAMGGTEEVMMRKTNERLERELRESLEREERIGKELERVRARLRVTEEAEERLCSQLGDLEAESNQQDRAYYLQIKALTEQLAHAHSLLRQWSSSAAASYSLLSLGGQAA